MPGGKWDQGAYEYTLAQGTAGNAKDPDYYLQNTKAYTNTFKTMLNIPIMNVMMARTGMNSLQKRLGDLRDMSNPNKKQGVWVRSYYKQATVDDLAKTDMNLFGAEAGYDWLFRAEEPTKLYAGVLVGFMDATNIKTAQADGTYSKGEGQTPAVGLYATLVNDNRWFVDIAARNFWTKLDMTNYASDGTELKFEPSRNVLAASVETGKSFISQLDRNRFIRIEPKAEISYMNAASADTDVENGTGKLSYDSANYVDAKAGVLLGYTLTRRNGLLIEPLVELAYRQTLVGEDKVTYDGTTQTNDLKGGSVEANVGLNMQLTDNLYWYTLGSYEAGSKIKGWGVYAGVRYTFGSDNTAKMDKKMRVKKIATIDNSIQYPHQKNKVKKQGKQKSKQQAKRKSKKGQTKKKMSLVDQIESRVL